MSMVRVVMPAHLRTLAKVSGEVQLEIKGPVTQRSILNALEDRYPMLQGTIRDHVTQQRRAFVRFFACQGRTEALPNWYPHSALSLSEPIAEASRVECRRLAASSRSTSYPARRAAIESYRSAPV